MVGLNNQMKLFLEMSFLLMDAVHRGRVMYFVCNIVCNNADLLWVWRWLLCCSFLDSHLVKKCSEKNGTSTTRKTPWTKRERFMLFFIHKLTHTHTHTHTHTETLVHMYTWPESTERWYNRCRSGKHGTQSNLDFITAPCTLPQNHPCMYIYVGSCSRYLSKQGLQPHIFDLY